MATIGEPIVHDITIYQGTDHEWLFRRIDENGQPVIPDSAFSQVRDVPNGKLWATLTCVVDPVTGWITLTLPHSATKEVPWFTRKVGAWDMEVLINNKYYRWVMGKVTVSPEVTKDV